MATLTASNSSLSITVPGIFSSPQTIQGYAVDDAFSAEAVERAEVMIGVDGNMSYGYIFNVISVPITIQADSPSLAFFNTWKNIEDGNRELSPGNGVVMLPGIGWKFTLANLILANYPVLPDVKKILQPLKFVLKCQSIVGTQI